MSIVKLKKDEELNDRHLAMSSIMHNIAEQVMEQTWNIAIVQLDKFSPITGNDAISHLSTLAAHFTAKFLLHMKNIVDKDDTGYSIEELQQGVFDGISAMLSTKEIVVNKQQSNSEIKRL